MALSAQSALGKAQSPRVLAIQSTVSHGYVGNKAATFPMQCLGFNVDAINTVSLSNHPNYENGFKGQFLSADQMSDTLKGLEDNTLLNHDVIINGYTRSVDLLNKVRDAVVRVKEQNPSAIYVCDPVLGDNGEFYVPSELLEVYKTQLLPLADVITPNYFEVEVLSGVKISCESDVITACNALHDLGPTICILTGQRLAKQRQSIFLSTRYAGEANPTILRIDVPSFEGYFYGCGDLLTALCASGIYRATKMTGKKSLAEGRPDSNSLGLVLEHAAWAMNEVLEKTRETGGRELRIIESIDVFRKLYDDWTRLRSSSDSAGNPQYTAFSKAEAVCAESVEETFLELNEEGSGGVQK